MCRMMSSPDGMKISRTSSSMEIRGGSTDQAPAENQDAIQPARFRPPANADQRDQQVLIFPRAKAQRRKESALVMSAARKYTKSVSKSRSPRPGFYCGIEGGSTKTVAVVIDGG